MMIGNRERWISELSRHLDDFSRWFNLAATNESLDVRVDPASVIRWISTHSDRDLNGIYRAFTAFQVDEHAIRDAVDIISRSVRNQSRSGIASVCQRNQQGTAMMTLFAIPIHYLANGCRYAPYFLTGHLNLDRDQTQASFYQFMLLYGNIEVVTTERTIASERGKTSSVWDNAAGVVEKLSSSDPTISPNASLAEHVVAKHLLDGTCNHVELYRRRVQGFGYEVMLIVDATRSAEKPPLKSKAKLPRVLTKVFDGIHPDFLSETDPSFMVGIVDSPFDVGAFDALQAW
jgi:hypothetical protein